MLDTSIEDSLACYTGQYPIQPPYSMEKLCFEKR